MSDKGGGKGQRAHVLVSGMVQGVAFRYYAQRKAEELGVSGWVRNLPDGRVEAVFEGTWEKVREMVRWCEEGPPHAGVEDVEAEFEAPGEDLDGFEMR